MNPYYITELVNNWGMNYRKTIPKLGADLLYGIENEDVDSVADVVWHPISNINIISIFDNDSGISQIGPLPPLGMDD